MQLRPRHFVLFAVVFAVFVYNIIRHRRPPPVAPTQHALIAPVGPRPSSTAWTAFDHAASLRDAPDPQFQPAFDALQQQIAAAPSQPGMEGCLTWLEFYRQGVLHPARDPQWKQRSQQHLDSCARFHADLAS
jgi:hypothetical protein